MTTPKRNEAVAWRRRYVCPQEGPSLWLPCDGLDVPTLRAAGCYEIEPLYSAATVDALRGEVQRLRAGAEAVVLAFEALGKSRGIVADRAAHRQCEATLVTLKSILDPTP